jgi:hypothetical protein
LPFANAKEADEFEFLWLEDDLMHEHAAHAGSATLAATLENRV